MLKPALDDRHVQSPETPIRLRHAAKWTGDLFLEFRGDQDTPLLGLSADWTLVKDGDLYFLGYASESASQTAAVAAQSRGAAALCVSRPLGMGLPELVVTDVHRALSRVAAAFNGSPAHDLVLSGVTGTKGKTTTTYLLKSILAAAGDEAGLIGSGGAWVAGRHISSNATTPEAPELHALLAQMRQANLKKVVLEVSSHGISRQRIHGLKFATIAFTNLSRDHLDEHGDMESYFEAKAALFARETTQCAALNVDDAHGRALRDRCVFPTLGFGLRHDADVRGEAVHLGAHGSEFMLRTPEGDRLISTPLIGKFNVENCLGASTMALQLGVELDAIVEGLRKPPPIPGRMEMIDQGQPFRVVVDFAHNPASLSCALDAARLLCRVSGRVICVLGFSGGGDAAKRPIMRDIAVEQSDVLLLTVNNPRRRSPEEILGDVSADVLENEGVLLAFMDRAEAIEHSIRLADVGDVVLIVGRGNQTHQIVGKERLPFDDRQVARDCLSAIGFRRYSRREFGARLAGRPSAPRQQTE